MTITTRHAQEKDIPGLKALWKEAFADDDEYIDLFFADLFRPEDMVVLEADGRLACMAALLPCTLVLGADSGTQAVRWPISYLYAMCTAKALRRKGLGRRLLRFAAEHCSGRGDSGIALLPADEGLHYFYGLEGYKEAFTLVPRTDNYIEYPQAYLAHCEAIGDVPADDGSMTGVFLALSAMPPFTAYMAYPMD